MPTPYQIALLLMRLTAAVSILAGVSAIGGAILAAILSLTSIGPLLAGWANGFLLYGAFYLLIGTMELILSKRLARFAAKAVES